MYTPDFTITYRATCPLCGNRDSVEVPSMGYARWRAGALIQDAMPQLSADERELLISGTCRTCWDEYFYDDGEDL
jgi:hypothetical protein